jgi:NAD(P)-dependent dehydrogenase (short-subunit alcohol dehydrogenase family)
MVDIDDIAGSVEFLLSEKARNITGITLTVDAGNIA